MRSIDQVVTLPAGRTSPRSSNLTMPMSLQALVVLLLLWMQQQATGADDCDTLQQFKGVFGSSVLPSWSGSSCCQWDGISCNNQYRVTSIRLGSVGDQLSVHNASFDMLARLPALTALNLSGVHMQSLSQGILRLQNLEELSLWNCNISFPGLPDLSSFTGLRYLDLGYNSWTASPYDPWGLTSFDNDPIGICRMPQLTYLGLAASVDPQTGFLYYLNGSIPSCIGNLQNLVTLDLHNQALEGIPDSFSTLENLQVLDLRSNTFIVPLTSLCGLRQLRSLQISNSGFANRLLPDCLFNTLPNLEFLDVSKNAIYGEIPASIGNLTNLQTLLLGANEFTGSLPAAIGNLTELQTLSIDNDVMGVGLEASLGGPIPSSWASLRSLRTLVLTGVNVSGSLTGQMISAWPSLEELQIIRVPGLGGEIASANLPLNLSTLIITGTSIGGRLPEHIGRLSRLERLELSNNSFSGELPASIANLSAARAILLNKNSFTGSIPITHSWSSLEVLDLSENSLTGSIPSNLGPNLQMLEVSQNSLSGPFPSSLASVAYVRASQNQLTALDPAPTSNTRLQVLDLSDNSLTGEIPPWLANQTELTDLNLAANSLSGGVPWWLQTAAPPSLQSVDLSVNSLNGTLTFLPPVARLDLHSNRLTGDFRLSQTAGRENVTVFVDVSGNLFTGISPQASTIAQLTELHASNCRIQGNIPSVIMTAAPSLWTVDLSYNQLSGAVPSSMSTLLGIDLSHNNLSGALPRWGSAQDIDVSHNSLGGSIPQELGESDDLETLDLSFNQFTGILPSNLGNLNLLTVFNVSHNHLSGRIPSNGSLAEFDASAFAHNDGLCGTPLPPCH